MKIGTPLHSRFIVLIMLLILTLQFLAPRLRAQVSLPPLPRIGDDIEAAEIAYFGLFPTCDDPRSATVTRSDTGMTIAVQSDEGIELFSLSACEADVFARCLDAYERMGESGQAMEVLGQELQDPALQRCFASFMQKRVFVLPTPHEAKGMKTGFVLHDGDRVEGIPLAVTDRRIALWTGDGGYDHRRLDSKLTVVQYADIDSLLGTYYINSSERGWLGWLLSTAALTSGISMGQRDPWSGRGGSGSMTFILPTALVTSGIVSILPALLTASILGEERASVGLTERNREEMIFELRDKLMSEYPPPEVLDLFARTPIPAVPELSERSGESTQPSMQSSTADARTSEVADIGIGIEFLFNWYRVDSRPFAGMPALALGREFPIIRDSGANPVLSLFPHLSLGPLHSAAGLRLLLHAGQFGSMYAGFDWVTNWDEMGHFTESGMGWGRRQKTQLLKDSWLQSAFVSFGYGFRLAGCDVLCEFRMEVEPGVLVETEDWWYTEYENPDRSQTGPSLYGGLGLTILYPLNF
ncbi:MAG: hypothetical protein IH600_05875 [Bacteroidetes bacterium]|nr:hypothetical protein [Bacteroidota bacterium]